MKKIVLLLFCLSIQQLAAASDLMHNWRQKVEQEQSWQRYFARSEHWLRRDQQMLADELKQSGQNYVSKPAKHNKFGFDEQKGPAFLPPLEAQRIALVILSFQTASGGWSKRTDMATQNRQAGQRFGVEKDYIPTFDNSATSTQLRWLAAYFPFADTELKPKLKLAVQRGIHFVLQAQYPNGGFPQTYPLRANYHDAITLNDNVTVELLSLLSQVATEPLFAFVSESIRAQAKIQFDQGVELLLRAQLVLNDQLTVWASQYEPVSLQPVQARAYELPALISSESAAVTLLLMQRVEPSDAVIASVEAAVAWFKQKQIKDTQMIRSENGVQFLQQKGAKPLWARFYDLNRQQPLFVDRDGTIVPGMAQLSIERQKGYGWYQSNAEEVLKAYPVWKAKLGAKK